MIVYVPASRAVQVTSAVAKQRRRLARSSQQHKAGAGGGGIRRGIPSWVHMPSMGESAPLLCLLRLFEGASRLGLHVGRSPLARPGHAAAHTCSVRGP